MDKCCGNCEHAGEYTGYYKDCVICQHPTYLELRPYEELENGPLPYSCKVVTDDYQDINDGINCPCWKEKQNG